VNRQHQNLISLNKKHHLKNKKRETHNKRVRIQTRIKENKIKLENNKENPQINKINNKANSNKTPLDKEKKIKILPNPLLEVNRKPRNKKLNNN